MRKLIALALFGLLSINAFAAESYRVAWSHYTGWEPWGYAADNGIIKKWADKYGIEIEVTLINDYIESINLYTAGQFDAVTLTNMDALTIPAVGGIDSTAIIIGDFSNGNDGLVAKQAASIKDLKDEQIRLVMLSVSHYMLSRALEMNGMSEKDVKLVNTSDADIASIFISEKAGAAVTWNPPLQQARNAKGAKLLFDSSKIPGEIIDMMLVKTQASDKLKKALAGAWYETMQIMSAKGKASADAIAYMAKLSGATVPEFKAQLKTTSMFYDPKKAVEFAKSMGLKKTMTMVRDFSFDKGLYGDGAPSADFVGIEFPDKGILGDTKNVKLRFDASYMQMAAEGKL